MTTRIVPKDGEGGGLSRKDKMTWEGVDTTLDGYGYPMTKPRETWHLILKTSHPLHPLYH